MNYIYSLYNITLAVPFPCPMLTLAATGAVPDVTVVEAQVPRNLPVVLMKDRAWQTAPGQFLLRGGARAGRFLVEDGLKITLERNPDAEEELLCALLITTVMAALLRQRELLVLHANVAVTQHGAIAIAGESGSGKSTTQAALLKRGYPMLADDVTVLQQNPEGTVIALPGVPKMNLCVDAAMNLGHDVVNLSRNPLMGTKVIVPVAECDCVTDALPLKTIFLISRHTGESLIINRLNGIGKFAALQDCIYGPQLPEEAAELFPLVKSVTEQVKIITIQRPFRGCSVDQVVEAILNNG